MGDIVNGIVAYEAEETVAPVVSNTEEFANDYTSIGFLFSQRQGHDNCLGNKFSAQTAQAGDDLLVAATLALDAHSAVGPPNERVKPPNDPNDNDPIGYIFVQMPIKTGLVLKQKNVFLQT